MKRLQAFIPLLALALLAAPDLPACGPFPPDDEPGFGGEGVLALFSPWYVPDSLFIDLLDEADGLLDWNEGGTDHLGEYSRIHTEEWLVYLGWSQGGGPGEVLAEILDAEDPSSEFQKKIVPLLPKGTPADRRTGTLNYLKLMGDANKAVGIAQSAGWYGEASAEDPDWKGILNRSLQAIGGTKDAFLKERYAFQAVRAASMADAHDQAVELYNTHFASGGGTDLLRYRAMGYAARSLYQKGQTQSAFGYYIAVFDQCPTLSAETLRSLQSISISDETFDRWTEALDSPHRRAVAAYAHALIDPHRDLLRYIESILRWEPASPHAAKLLMSMVRSIEAESLPRTLSSLAAPRQPLQEGAGVYVPEWRSAPSFDDARVARLLQTIRQARAGGAVSYPGLWLAAEAHVRFLSGDLKAARAALDQGTGSAKLNALEQGLLHMESTVLALSSATGSDWQARLAEDAKFLDQLAADRHESRPRKTFFSLLANRHLAAGDIGRAAMGFEAAGSPFTASFLLDIYGEPEDLEALEALLMSPGTDEDRILSARFPYKAEDMRYLAGVRLMRRGDFTAALASWEELPDSYWDRSEMGPTGEAPLLHVQVSFDNTYLNPGKGLQELSRREAAEKLADLKDSLEGLRGSKSSKDRQAAAEAAAALGCAFLSTPFLGYADLLWDGGLVYSMEFLDLDKWPFLIRGVGDGAREAYARFRGEYDHLAVAAGYFEEAASLETNREKAARHALTAIPCWGAEMYNGQYMQNWSEEKESRVEQSRKSFAKRYANTAFYRSYVRSTGGCPGIDDYR